MRRDQSEAERAGGARGEIAGACVEGGVGICTWTRVDIWALSMRVEGNGCDGMSSKVTMDSSDNGRAGRWEQRFRTVMTGTSSSSLSAETGSVCTESLQCICFSELMCLLSAFKFSVSKTIF